MNIIFLDIDGVLNSMAYFESITIKNGHNELCKYHLVKLAEIYHECNCKIVLASTWRCLDGVTAKACYEMYNYLVQSLKSYGMEIISKTPMLGNNRPREISSWLSDNGDVVRFVILDDDFTKDDYTKYGLDEHLVKTEFFCRSFDAGGLQDRHVSEAINILKNKE